MPILPSCEGCNIVRSERNQRVLPIALRRKKSAVARALEQHDLIGPDAPIRERLAKILGNGPKIFSHDDAPMFDAGEGSNRQHRLEGKVNVDPAVRLYAVGNAVETVPAQDLFQSNT